MQIAIYCLTSLGYATATFHDPVDSQTNNWIKSSQISCCTVQIAKEKWVANENSH